MRPLPTFELQFPRIEIKDFAARYQYKDDAEPLEAGQRIRRGEYTRANLEVIFRWKTAAEGFPGLIGMLTRK